MAKFSSDAIRNICLLGHGGDGKTSIAEAMLYLAKATDRLGRIADGNTVCDFDPEEIKRGFSLSASLAHFEWKGKKINLLDTPATSTSPAKCSRPSPWPAARSSCLRPRAASRSAPSCVGRRREHPQGVFRQQDGRRERRLRYGVPIPAREIRQERLPGHRALRKGRGGGIL